MTTRANGRPTKLERAIQEARTLHDRAAEIGMEIDRPLTESDIGQRAYLNHLTVGCLLEAVERLAGERA